MVKEQIYNVGIYVRLSRDDERLGESLSIENQRTLLRKHVEERGWNETEIYVDDGYSGTNFDRPAFQQMISDVKEGKINLILVKDLSRFGRNYIQIGEFTDYILPSFGCRLIALNDGVDTIHNENDIMPFKNLFNEFYSRDISKKVKSAKVACAKDGKFMGSYAPYGYIKNPENRHQLIIDEVASAMVKRIFSMRCEGISFLRIATILNDEKIMTPRDYYYQSLGKPNPRNVSHKWNDIGVASILKNEVYIGNIVQFKSGSISYKNKKQVKKSEEEWIRVEGMHEPIIDLDIWNRVQEINQRQGKFRTTNTGTVSLFSGLLECSTCGFSMKVTKDNRPKADGTPRSWQAYICCTYSRSGPSGCSPHRISMSHISQIVLDDIKANAERIQYDENSVVNELRRQKNKEFNSENSSLKKELSDIKYRLSQLEKLTQNLYEDKVAGNIPVHMFENLMKKYEQERSEKIYASDLLEKKIQVAEKNEYDISKWVELIKKYMHIEKLNREILLQLIEKIVVSEKVNESGIEYQDVKIFYNFVGHVNS